MLAFLRECIHLLFLFASFTVLYSCIDAVFKLLERCVKGNVGFKVCLSCDRILTVGCCCGYDCSTISNKKSLEVRRQKFSTVHVRGKFF